MPIKARLSGSVYEEPLHSFRDLEVEVILVRLVVVRRQDDVEQTLVDRLAEDGPQLGGLGGDRVRRRLGPAGGVADRAVVVLVDVEVAAVLLDESRGIDRDAAVVPR